MQLHTQKTIHRVIIGLFIIYLSWFYHDADKQLPLSSQKHLKNLIWGIKHNKTTRKMLKPLHTHSTSFKDFSARDATLQLSAAHEA